jgi:putative ABC transport system ATP-binding protein
MRSVVAADRLRALPLFAGLETAEVELAASMADELSVDTGAKVVAEDEFGYSLYVVEQGTADVLQDGATIATLCSGDLCGELGLLVTGRRTATVVATSPLTLLAYFDADYRRLERQVPVLARRIRTEMARRELRPSADRAAPS